MAHSLALMGVFELKKGVRGWYVINFRYTDNVVPTFVLKSHGFYEQDGWTTKMYHVVENDIDGNILDYIKIAFPNYDWDERYM